MMWCIFIRRERMRSRRMLHWRWRVTIRRGRRPRLIVTRRMDYAPNRLVRAMAL